MIAAVVAATGAMAAAVLAVGLGSGGCFSPRFEACAVTCGEGSACPDDQFCLADGKCHASQDEALCSPGGGDASVDDGDDTVDDGDDVTDDADDVTDDADDSDDVTDDLPPDAGPPDAAPPDAGTPVTPTSPGDLVISEIHNDPQEGPELAAEWFEILNPTRQTFDLQGLIVRDQDKDVFEVDGQVIVPPGGRVVLARLANPDENGGLTGVDFAYGDLFTLANGEDEVVIQNPDNDAVLDSVVYGFDFPNVDGASMSLDPDLENATDNNLAESWCAGVTVYGAGDLGSPGAPNPDC